MRQIFFMVAFLLIFISCSKNKFDYIACPTADNMQVSYKADIKPIIANRCSYGVCHAASPRDSTLVYDFSTYSGLKGAIGSVYNRIIREVDDPLFMPKKYPGDSIAFPMDSCDLALLKIWIQNGAPEN